MRLVDADAILKRAEESFKNAGLHGEDYRKFKKWLRKEPTIDAVEVVRCKNCKHSHMTYDGRCKYCDKWEEDGEALYLDGDFYCAYGERREDGEA